LYTKTTLSRQALRLLKNLSGSAETSPSSPSGMVHANVGHEVMLITLSKGYFCTNFSYDGLVTSQVHPQQHKKQPTNTTTMLMEPLAPPAGWIQ
jgi:hypothetical protein